MKNRAQSAYPFRRSDPEHQGFALIISLSMMSFVVLVVVLLATQLRLSLAASSADRAMTEARETAQLGLAVAVGELQRHAGPDRRVTARAEINTAGVMPETSRHWTGVWNSTSGSNAPLRWLVSGTRDPAVGPAADEARLVGPADSSFPGGLEPEYWVTVPYEDIASGQRIAWWVSDEGTKANVSRVGDDPRFPVGSDFESRLQRSIQIIQGASRTGFERLVSADFDQATHSSLIRRAQRPADLLLVGDAWGDLSPARFHALTAASVGPLTTASAGVLSNTLEGGLRRNIEEVLENPEIGESDPFLNGSLAPFLDAEANYRLVDDEFLGEVRALNAIDHLPVGWDRSGPRRLPTPPAGGFAAYHHFAPIITEFAIYFSVFQRSNRPAIRYYIDVELWNPYPFPLLLSLGDTRALTVLVEGLPELRISRFSSAGDFISASNWIRMDNVPLSSGVRETSSWLQIDSRGRGPWPNSRPALLMPGEVYRLEDPDPRHQPQGLWKDLGNIEPSNVEATDRVVVEGRAPGGGTIGRINVRLVRGNSQGTGANRRIPGDPPIFEVANIPYEGDPNLFQHIFDRADGQISSFPRRVSTKRYLFGSGSGSAIDVQDSYIFALHFRLGSEDPADIATFLQNFDFRRPRIDFSEQLETPDGPIPMARFIRSASGGIDGSPAMNPVLVEQAIDEVFPLGPTEIFRDGLVREQNPEPSNVAQRYADLRYLDAPPLVRPSSLAGFRHAYFVGLPPFSLTEASGESLNEAFDRYFLSTVPESGWAPDGGIALPNPWLQPIDPAATVADLRADDAAARLWVQGAFNLNSTLVEAWRALLSQRTNGAELVYRTHDTNRGGTLALDNYFVRSPSGALLLTPGLSEPEIAAIANTQDRRREQMRHGYRTLEPEQIHHLAHHITRLLRERGRPFGSLAEFINSGLVAEAIEAVGPGVPELNLLAVDPINMGRSGFEPTFLRQTDVISALAPVQTVRSDTFNVRVEGESSGNFGAARTRVRLEATLQRTPDPAISGGDPMDDHDASFGRRFVLTQIRWLEDS